MFNNKIIIRCPICGCVIESTETFHICYNCWFIEEIIDEMIEEKLERIKNEETN